MRKETVMNITEREIDDPEKGGVILEYVNFTKEAKGNLSGDTQKRNNVFP